MNLFQKTNNVVSRVEQKRQGISINSQNKPKEALPQNIDTRFREVVRIIENKRRGKA